MSRLRAANMRASFQPAYDLFPHRFFARLTVLFFFFFCCPLSVTLTASAAYVFPAASRRTAPMRAVGATIFRKRLIRAIAAGLGSGCICATVRWPLWRSPSVRSGVDEGLGSGASRETRDSLARCRMDVQLVYLRRRRGRESEEVVSSGLRADVW